MADSARGVGAPGGNKAITILDQDTAADREEVGRCVPRRVVEANVVGELGAITAHPVDDAGHVEHAKGRERDVVALVIDAVSTDAHQSLAGLVRQGIARGGGRYSLRIDKPLPPKKT